MSNTAKYSLKAAVALLMALLVSPVFSQEKVLFENCDLVVEPAKEINTAGSDISPFFVNDSLYFSAVREKYIGKSSRERKNKAFYSIYSAGTDGDGRLNSGRKLVPGFGGEWHEGPADYCAATGEMFLTLSSISNADTIRKMFSEEDIRLMLVIRKKINGSWQTTEILPFNNDKYHYAHPAISVTGDTLVFVSDRDSTGFGKSDLYMAVRKNGVWLNPVNLGDKVNTPGNEMFPTFIGGKILSFASDLRKGGYGRFDIWYVPFPVTGTAQNAGPKINSEFDDFGLVVHHSGKTGYFSSNRGNMGSDDIFRLDINALFVMKNGKVVDNLTGLPIPQASVTLFNCKKERINTVFTDYNGNFTVNVNPQDCPELEAAKEEFAPVSEKPETEYTEIRLTRKKKYEISVLDFDTKQPLTNAVFSENGVVLNQKPQAGVLFLLPPFRQNAKMMVSADGYLDQSVIIDTTRFREPVLKDTIYLYKKQLNKTFVLDNIYYNYDKWDILPASKLELNRLVKIMKDNPDIKVELGSHTDARGSDAYNLQLSQKRSESAVKYIVESGIDKSRIVAKGYGETRLINHCKNGVQCPDDLHRQNRRTEFKIIGL